MKRLAAVALLSLTACASPQTVAPLASADEIAEETRLHHRYLRDARAQGHVVGGRNTRAVRPRLEAVAKRIAPAAVALCEEMDIADPQGCAYSIHTKRGAEDQPNAYADGRAVFITGSMVRHTETDDELALVLAHEFAHNIMRHQAGITRNMLFGAVLGAAADAAIGQTGTGASIGAEAGALAYAPSLEHEADYIGMYITARAGYDYAKATEFWRRISLTLPDSIYFRHTHPTNPERYVVLNKTAAEIAFRQEKAQALVPLFRSQLAQQGGS